MRQELILAYEGNVTVKATRGGVVLNAQKAHNNGTNKLFKYISYCLAGKWTVAEKTKPYSIKLFSKTGESYTPASSAVSMTTSPIVTGTSVTYHFTIPYTYITEETFNCIRLYGAGVIETDGAHMAEVVIESVEVNTNQNLTYMIDWTLTIKNEGE